jgi:hypothetical protein
MPTRVSVFFLLSLLLTTGLSGCLENDRDFRVSAPRLGDHVRFEVEYPSGASVREASFTLLDTTTITLTDGQVRETVRVLYEEQETDREDSGAFWNSTFWFYVDRTSLRVVAASDTCSGSPISPLCTPVVHHYDVRGRSWAFGSAILQGNTLRPGTSQTLREEIHGEGVEVLISTDKRPGRDGTYGIRLTPSRMDSPAVRSASAMIYGDVTISPDNPYVLEANLWTYRRDVAGNAAALFELQVRQLSYIRGAGPMLERSEPAPPWRPCLETSNGWDGPLPPGSATVLQGVNVSFKEFIDYLADSHETFQEHVQSDAAVIELMRLRHTGGYEGPLGLTHENSYSSTVVFPLGENRAHRLQVAKIVEGQLLPPGERVRYWLEEEG